MLELLSGYNHVLPFLAHTLLVFLAETEQESMAKCGVFAIDDLGTDAMTMNRKAARCSLPFIT